MESHDRRHLKSAEHSIIATCQSLRDKTLWRNHAASSVKIELFMGDGELRKSMWTVDLADLDVKSEMPICAINGIQRPSHNLALSLLHLLILSGVLEASLAR